MTITATTRRCGACFHLLDGDEPKCPKCGTVPCVPVDQWPKGAMKLLYLLIITDALAVKLTSTPQVQAEFLLENAIRGRYYKGRLIPRAAAAAHCYPQFLELFEKWQAEGSPTDFTAIAQLRGSR